MLCLSQGATPPAERGGLQNYLWLQAERIGLAGGTVPGAKREDGAVRDAWLCPSHHSGSQSNKPTVLHKLLSMLHATMSHCWDLSPPVRSSGTFSRVWGMSELHHLAAKGASFSLITGRDFISWFHPRSPCNKAKTLCCGLPACREAACSGWGREIIMGLSGSPRNP